MDNFTISTRMTNKEYVRVMFIGLYKKPVYIIGTLLGIYILTTAALGHFHVVEYYSDTPWYEIAAGVFILCAPILILLIAYQQFISNPSFKNEITYTFGENGIAIQGPTFKSEMLWTHITRHKELGKFLILYHTKKFGNFIDKTKLTPAQIAFIKSKAGKSVL